MSERTTTPSASAAKYIFVTGGVTSSLGKGIISASLAKLLQARGFRVTIQKFDPYINIDPGTLNPSEHGECYVTDDGAEVSSFDRIVVVTDLDVRIDRLPPPVAACADASAQITAIAAFSVVAQQVGAVECDTEGSAAKEEDPQCRSGDELSVDDFASEGSRVGIETPPLTPYTGPERLDRCGLTCCVSRDGA